MGQTYTEPSPPLSLDDNLLECLSRVNYKEHINKRFCFEKKKRKKGMIGLCVSFCLLYVLFLFASFWFVCLFICCFTVNAGQYIAICVCTSRQEIIEANSLRRDDRHFFFLSTDTERKNTTE